MLYTKNNKKVKKDDPPTGDDLMNNISFGETNEDIASNIFFGDTKGKGANYQEIRNINFEDDPRNIIQDNTSPLEVLNRSFDYDGEILNQKIKSKQDFEEQKERGKINLYNTNYKLPRYEAMINKDEKDEIKKIQYHLQDQGYYENTRRGKIKIRKLKTPDDIKDIQQKLVNKGYDLGKFGSNNDGVDGIIGRYTMAAIQKYNDDYKINHVDGIWGANTAEAYNNYINNTRKNKNKKTDNITQGENINLPENISDTNYKNVQKSIYKYGYFKNKASDFKYDSADDIAAIGKNNNWFVNINNTTDRSQCTQYSNAQCRKRFGDHKKADKAGLYGDAWTIHNNLINSNAESIFNVFEGKNVNNINNPDIYANRLTKNAAQQIPIEKIKPGDFVNMYYSNSHYTNQAYRNRGDEIFTTHSGLIKQDKNGKKYVEHNIGGKIYKEPLKSFKNDEVKINGHVIRISAVTRPKYYGSKAKNKYLYQEQDGHQLNWANITNMNTTFGTKESAIYNQFITNNKKVFIEDMPVNEDEFYYLSKAAKVIPWKETDYGKVNNSKVKAREFGGKIRELAGIRESSEGLAKIKDEENFDDEIRKNLNINNETMNIPETAAIATMYGLVTRYTAIKLSIKDRNKYNVDELSQLALLSWNEPIHKVIETANKYDNMNDVINAYIKAYEKDGKEFPYKLALTAYNNYLQ